MENSGKWLRQTASTGWWRLGLYVCLLVLLSGCLASASCSTSASAVTAEPLLLFQKTPCYGSCPAYDATFYTDGRITYVGYRHAPVEDTLQLCLTTYELQQLKKALADLPYTSFADAYRSQRTDQPSTYLTFYQNSQPVKRIRHQEDGPAQLVQFQMMVAQLVLEKVEKSKHMPK